MSSSSSRSFVLASLLAVVVGCDKKPESAGIADAETPSTIAQTAMVDAATPTTTPTTKVVTPVARPSTDAGGTTVDAGATMASTDAGAAITDAGAAKDGGGPQSCCCDVGGTKSMLGMSECTKGGKGKCVKKDQCK